MLAAQWDNASAFLIVYDVTNDESFKNCKQWLERVRSLRPEKPLLGCIVANKIDLEERQKVSTSDGQDFARSNGLEYFETSALRGTDIEGPFHYLAKCFHKKYEECLEQFQQMMR